MRTPLRGLTLVELLLGLAIGLFVVAAALSLWAGRIREHRVLLLQGRLMQDLRVATEVVTRDLRRAGYWAAPIATTGNPYAAVAPASAASDAVSFSFSRDATEDHALGAGEQFGFRLRAGVIEMLLGDRWQALTDAGTVTITTFDIVPHTHEIALLGFCAQPCVPKTPQCMPRQLVRSLAVTISGRAVTERTLVRTVRSQVRLRNDAIVGSCPA
jgi:type IV pilus assembly protein PilW